MLHSLCRLTEAFLSTAATQHKDNTQYNKDNVFRDTDTQSQTRANLHTRKYRPKRKWDGIICKASTDTTAVEETRDNVWQLHHETHASCWCFDTWLREFTKLWWRFMCLCVFKETMSPTLWLMYSWCHPEYSRTFRMKYKGFKCGEKVLRGFKPGAPLWFTNFSILETNTTYYSYIRHYIYTRGNTCL